MKPLSILVADDEEHIRDLTQLWLTNAGYTVACASTGSEALKLHGKQHFDLLVTEVIMRDGDGLSVILSRRKARPPVRILAISAGGKYLQAENCVRLAKGLGAHATLFKPFNRQAFLDAGSRALPAASEAAG